MILRFKHLVKSALARKRILIENTLVTPFNRKLIKYGIGTYGTEHLMVHAWDSKTILNIGNYCSIADNVHIFLGGNHSTSSISTFPFGSAEELLGEREGHPLSKGNIEIGSDVWVGSHASIMSGVSIGHGAVIAAFSHVVKDVLPYSIVGGNPAKHIKFRIPEEFIPQLLEIAWWDWDEGVVMQNRDLLVNKLDYYSISMMKGISLKLKNLPPVK